MKIAAIDLGSNSVHLVIAEVTGTRGLRFVAREREMVRLGAGSLRDGRLREHAVARTLAVLGAFARQARAAGASDVRAVATSAVREAADGPAFVERVRHETGLHLEVLSGEEEGRLVFRAASDSLGRRAGRVLVIDIGGGSVELAAGADGSADEVVSARLGVLRLMEEFIDGDPLSPAAEAALEGHVRAVLGGPADALARRGFDTVIGTSGTVASLVGEAAGGALPAHGQATDAAALRTVRQRLVRSRHGERVDLPAIGARRADIVVAGAVLLDTALDLLRAPRLVFSDWALREGVLLETLRPEVLAGRCAGAGAR